MKNQPRHIAIIMDGNGRWAESRKHDRFWGHIRGAHTAKKIIESATELKLENLTLFAFSSENWKRPAKEINFLMKLLSRQLRRETEQLIANNIRFRYIGKISKLPKEAQEEVERAVTKTAACTGMTLTFALSYGGRQEITNMVQSIAIKCKEGLLDITHINEELISLELESSFLPDPDLVIRTSGEKRISNFFLWQSAYSEFEFVDKLWPEFTADDLVQSIASFLNRDRRFGKTPQQAKAGDQASEVEL